MYGVWWAGAEPDVTPAGDGAKGYNALALHPAGSNFPVHQDMLKSVYDKNKGAGKKEEVGHVLYNRGLIDGLLTVEAIRKAQSKFGNKPMTGEQVRWGFENLQLSAARLKELGFEGLISPIAGSCMDHSGAHKARIQQWDGGKWSFTSEWIEADYKYLRPKVDNAAKDYGTQKNITARDCAKES
jgi:branched-chain amino acid transport system substrate-binding protein